MNADRAATTSAEPGCYLDWRLYIDWPPHGLAVCKEVVFANAIAGQLADVPLLTATETKRALFLFRLLEEPGIGSDVQARLYVRLWSLGVIAAYNKAARDGFVREAERYTPRHVFASALGVEQAVQDSLWLLGGHGATVRDRRFVAELWDAQSQAHRAVLAVSGFRKKAKEIQSNAAGSRPALTVCRGRRFRRVPESELRARAPKYLEKYPDGWLIDAEGDGCGTIILDTPEPRHPKKYCNHCAKRAGETMNAGLTKHALARLRAAGWFG